MVTLEQYAIEKYVLPNGICPYDEWYSEQSREDQLMIDSRLTRVIQGTFGEINTVGGGVFEFKFRKGRAIRIYYTKIGLRIILLLVGGDKRTQSRDIAKAREWLEAFKKEK